MNIMELALFPTRLGKNVTGGQMLLDWGHGCGGTLGVVYSLVGYTSDVGTPLW